MCSVVACRTCDTVRTVTVTRSSHNTHQAPVELPKQQPAEGEFRRMSDTQMAESHSVFVKLIFYPRTEAHTSHLNWLFTSKVLHWNRLTLDSKMSTEFKNVG